MLRCDLGRKGQVGDTMTWIVATIIIVLILIFFIYASSLLAKIKSVEKFVKGIFSGENPDKGEDWIKIKTELAYNMDDKNKGLIEEWIKNEEKS